MEHRTARRKKVRQDVRLTSHCGDHFSGEIIDLSVGGAFIRKTCDFSFLRKIVRLRFPKGGNSDAYIECEAMIVRKESDGIAVMFDQRQKLALDAYPDTPDSAKAQTWPIGNKPLLPVLSDSKAGESRRKQAV